MQKYLILILFLIACQDQTVLRIRFQFAYEQPGPGYKEMPVVGSDQVFFLAPEILLYESHISRAEIFHFGERPNIKLFLTSEGTDIFARITSENVNKKMGMLIDGELRSAPTIRAQITSGEVFVIGFFKSQEVEAIVERINR